MRYALILAGGPAIMFEFKGCMRQSEGLPGIDELRMAKTWMFMASDGGNRRIACDTIDGRGVHALEAHWLFYVEGTQLTEIARSLKSTDEIELMRWTIRVCEAGMARIYENPVPGVTGREFWAHLHFENARSGGD